MRTVLAILSPFLAFAVALTAAVTLLLVTPPESKSIITNVNYLLTQPFIIGLASALITCAACPGRTWTMLYTSFIIVMFCTLQIIGSVSEERYEVLALIPVSVAGLGLGRMLMSDYIRRSVARRESKENLVLDKTEPTF